ncbi:MAG: SDR family oxidoreductase [Gammaproteobacteria bacterium]
MKIFLTGAGGFIGRHLIGALQRGGHTVIACVRKPAVFNRQYPQLHCVQGDFTAMTQVQDWQPLLQDADAVINCVGIIAESGAQTFAALHTLGPVALFKAAEQAGIKRIVQISALGADAEAQSPYHLSKKAADDFLATLNVDWFVLQPSIVYGDGAQSMALFHALAALPVSGVLDGGRQELQPVSVDDLCTTVLRCLQPEIAGRRIVAVVGPQAITFSELLAQLRRRLGKAPAPVISVPAGWAAHCGFLGQCCGIPALSADGIRMLLRGNSADAAPLAAFIGRQAASLTDKLFDKPATQAERWHAGLFFLRPVLRFAMALLWIGSGLVSAFFYPPQDSYRLLLAPLGIGGIFAPLTLYGLAFLDLLLGVALLFGYRLRRVIALQFAAIVVYSLVIAVALPEFWRHPFGPLLKNLPLLAALPILAVLEGERP